MPKKNTRSKRRPAQRSFESEILERLDTIAKLLQDLFILEALDEKMPVEQIRKALGVGKERVNRISRTTRGG